MWQKNFVPPFPLTIHTQRICFVVCRDGLPKDDRGAEK